MCEVTEVWEGKEVQDGLGVEVAEVSAGLTPLEGLGCRWSALLHGTGCLVALFPLSPGRTVPAKLLLLLLPFLTLEAAALFRPDMVACLWCQ